MTGPVLVHPPVDMPEGVEPGDSWCLGCEALDPKEWRFTREQAELIDWLICADCEDTFSIR